MRIQSGRPPLVCDTDLIRERIHHRTNGLIRDLEVSLLDGVLTVRGRAPRFYHKQLATSAVQEVANNIELENLISVKAH